jgi:hypothetical protein
MKKRLSTLIMAFGLAMALSIPAIAADLHGSHVGTECENGFASLHFVNNQTEGTSWAGTITVNFDSGSQVVQGADAVNRNVQHFWVYNPSGTELTGASTNLPGMLVLSEYTCNDDPYEPCDPYYDPYCDPYASS